MEEEDSTRLSIPKWVNGEKQLPITLNFRHIRKHWYQEGVYKDGLEVGIQEHEDKEGGQIEGYIYNTWEIFQTDSHVLWVNKLTGNFPDHNEQVIKRPNQYRKGSSVYR